MRKISVVGAGTMGNGIAQVAARAGFDVVLRDVHETFIERGMKAIDRSLQRDVDKDRLSPDDKQLIISRIATTTEWQPVADADLVIEAVTENLEIKLDVFRQLDSLTKPLTILASNTSSISITKLAAVTKRPDRVIGMHFMNPVPVMKLVEVIRGAATSDETYEEIRQMVETLGKVALDCQDSPGFISNRVLMPMINEAIFTLYEGVATRESIDGIMKLGMNHPMGPLALADFIGLDVCLAIMNVLYEGFNDPKYRPCPLLKRYVDAGWLGRKSGRGFYDTSNVRKRAEEQRFNVIMVGVRAVFPMGKQINRVHCQMCRASNLYGQELCSRCGTRLMIISEPSKLKHEESGLAVTSIEQLLERLSALENEVTKLSNKLATVSDLAAKQTKRADSVTKLMKRLLNTMEKGDSPEPISSPIRTKKRARSRE